MTQLIKALSDIRDQLIALRDDLMELHVQIQELVEYIQYHEKHGRRDGHLSQEHIQEIKQRLNALQRNISRK